MWLFKLAWKNLWRNRSRTLITTSAVAFATLISVISASLKEGVFDNLIKNIVSSYTGHLQIHLKGYQDEQVLDNSFPEDLKLERVLLTDKEVRAWSTRLESFALASSGEKTKGCLVLGIDPEKEKAVTGWDQRITAGNFISGRDSGVVMGEQLAERLQLRLGDTVILIGQGYHGSTAAGKYRVNGLMKLGSPQLNERLMLMPLQQARDFLSAADMLTSAVVILEEGEKLDQHARRIRAEIGNTYEVLAGRRSCLK